MRKLVTGIIPLIAVFYLSCTPPTLVKPGKLEYSELAAWPLVYKANFEKLMSLQGQARISVESPEGAMSFDINVIYVAPDTLFMSAEGPFGIDLGKIFMGKNRFIIYNQFNNQFFSGELDEDYYNTFLQTDLSLKQIKNAFLGYVPLPDNLKLVDQQHGIFAAMVGDQKWRITVDRKSGTLQSLEISQDNQTILKEELQEYRSIDGIIFPKFIRLTVPDKKEMVAIFYKNFKINETVNKDLYHIEIGPKTKQLIINR